jgi:hypothetical protein
VIDANVIRAFAQAFLEYLSAVFVNWIGIVLFLIGLVGLIERAIDYQGRFTVSTRKKLVVAFLLLFSAQFLAYKSQRDEVVRLTSSDDLVPLYVEGQRMWRGCLTIGDAKIDEWSGRVEAHLKGRHDTRRIARFEDESSIPSYLPDAAVGTDHTVEQEKRCFRLHARLFRLNEFVKELR